MKIYWKRRCKGEPLQGGFACQLSSLKSKMYPGSVLSGHVLHYNCRKFQQNKAHDRNNWLIIDQCDVIQLQRIVFNFVSFLVHIIKISLLRSRF